VTECDKNRRILITSPSGYLTSDQTRRTKIGSVRCPYRIVARPGQRINLTLYTLQLAVTTPHDLLRMSSSYTTRDLFSGSDGSGGRDTSTGSPLCREPYASVQEVCLHSLSVGHKIYK